MKQLILSIVTFLAFVPLAWSQSQKISAMTPAATLTGTELIPIVQGGANKSATPNQIAALASGGNPAAIAYQVAGNPVGYGGTNANFIFIGDSYTYGVNATHGFNDYPACCATLSFFTNRGSVYNYGISGETSSNKLVEFTSQAYPLLPTNNAAVSISYVFYECGVNDSNGVGTFFLPSLTLSNIQLYANLVVSNGGKFIVATIPDYNNEGDTPQSAININEGIYHLTNIFAVADLAEWLPNSYDPTYFIGNHPNLLGYQKWAQNLNSLMLKGAGTKAFASKKYGNVYDTMFAGAAALGNGYWSAATLSDTNDINSPTNYAILQLQSGETDISCRWGQNLYIKAGGQIVIQANNGTLFPFPIQHLMLGSSVSGVWGIKNTNVSGTTYGIGETDGGAVFSDAVAGNYMMEGANIELQLYNGNVTVGSPANTQSQFILNNNFPLEILTNNAIAAGGLWATNGIYGLWNSNGICLYWRHSLPGTINWLDTPVFDPAGNAIFTNITALPAGVFSGNGNGLTNCMRGFTNSTASAILIPNGGTYTLPASGFLSVNVVMTNNQIVWLTNNTSHYCVMMGNTVGVWTNYDNANMLCNSGDTVTLTNMIGGPNLSGIINETFQGFK